VTSNLHVHELHPRCEAHPSFRDASHACWKARRRLVLDGPPEVLSTVGLPGYNARGTLNRLSGGPRTALGFYGCHGVVLRNRGFESRENARRGQRTPKSMARYLALFIRTPGGEFDSFPRWGTSNPWGVDFYDDAMSFLPARDSDTCFT